MQKRSRIALAAVSLAFLMGSTGCEFFDGLSGLSNRADAPDATAKDKAVAVVIDSGADLAAGLCPLGAQYIEDVAASASPILAASVKVAAEAACAKLVGVAIPAGATTGGLPAYCALPSVESDHRVTADEALTFNTLRAARCG